MRDYDIRGFFEWGIEESRVWGFLVLRIGGFGNWGTATKGIHVIFLFNV